MGVCRCWRIFTHEIALESLGFSVQEFRGVFVFAATVALTTQTMDKSPEFC